MKILLARTVWDHHSKKSGYDNVFQHFTGKEYHHVINIVPLYPSFWQRVINFLMSLAIRDFREHYGINYLIFELKIILQIWFKKIDVIHLTDVEKNYRFFPKLLAKSKIRTIGTVHLPPAFYKVGWRQLQQLEYLDELIVLDKKSQIFYQTYFPNKKIHFIPHAVDTDHFKPSNQGQTNMFKYLFIGRFLRDLKTLSKTILLAKEKEVKNLEFHLVYTWQSLDNTDGFPFISILKEDFVIIHNHLNDNDLLDLYQQCQVLFIPLFDATANNGILEAMACGMPIITTSTTGGETYITNKKNGFICPQQSAEKLLEAVISLKENANLYSNMSECARQVSEEQFSISVVKSQLKLVYMCD